MHSIFDEAQKSLRLQEIENSQQDASFMDENASWVTAFNTSLLTTRAQQKRDPASELGDLMQTPEFKCLLIAAQHLATTEGYSKEAATERLIDVFRRIDKSWKQVVMSRGMKTLIGE